MKKFSALFVVAMALMLGACQNNQNTTEGDGNANDSTAKTTLVAYFTASELRNTERVAKNLAVALFASIDHVVAAISATASARGIGIVG